MAVRTASQAERLRFGNTHVMADDRGVALFGLDPTPPPPPDRRHEQVQAALRAFEQPPNPLPRRNEPGPIPTARSYRYAILDALGGPDFPSQGAQAPMTGKRAEDFPRGSLMQLAFLLRRGREREAASIVRAQVQPKPGLPFMPNSAIRVTATGAVPVPQGRTKLQAVTGLFSAQGHLTLREAGPEGEIVAHFDVPAGPFELRVHQLLPRGLTFQDGLHVTYSGGLGGGATFWIE